MSIGITRIKRRVDTERQRANRSVHQEELFMPGSVFFPSNSHMEEHLSAALYEYEMKYLL